ncbi:hypothetical protein F66182_2514 [Fusarium sp. NRRL 66182]|nr:hypothetical protein F66182_2514 [Fusarium sp. NRRL 66182]
MYPLATVTSLLAVAGAVTATLEPALSNSKGKYPANPGCSPTKISEDIQAAECAHNTRVSGKQTFAVFKVKHKFDRNHGAPYGTCTAYMCTAPTVDQLTDDADYWTFFWNNNSKDAGVGTGCVRSPDDGVCGCQNSNGKFIPRGKNCV